MKEAAIAICRETYDWFVMGGMEPDLVTHNYVAQIIAAHYEASPEWTEEELTNFGKLASQPQPAPTEHLIKAMATSPPQDTSSTHDF